MFGGLYTLHRWLGVAGGLMVCIWYASGLGLHWRALPATLSPDEIHRTLGEPFRHTQVATSFTDILKTATEPMRDIRLRRAGGRLVYDLRTASGRVQIIDAQTGESLLPVTEELARDIAQTLQVENPIEAAVLMSEPDAYYANLRQPVYRVTFDDLSRTRVYVGAQSASILARARIRERLYTHFVNHPHYLTFPFLRRYPGLSDIALLVLNTLALLLVASGAVLGAWKIARSGFLVGIGPRSLVVRRWHRLLGLAFSITTLGYVVSAFFLIFPENNVPQLGIVPRPAEMESVLRPIDPPRYTLRSIDAIDLKELPVAADQLSMVTLQHVVDVPMYTFEDTRGRQVAVRADTGRGFQIDHAWLARIASAFIGEKVTVTDVRYMEDYDEYYYARNNRIPPLPAYRVTVNNDDQTLLYLSAATGAVVGRATREFRVRRWLLIGPHTWDWPFLMRRPLLWHAVVITLIVGGLGVTLSGLYLGAQVLAGLVRGRRRTLAYARRRAS